MPTPPTKIAFQGAPGAYSDMAARALFPDCPTLPCTSFAAAFAAVRDGAASHAVIPIDNTLAGRVADVHELLGGGRVTAATAADAQTVADGAEPAAGAALSVCGEYFLPVRHNLLGVAGATTATIRHVWSHTHALPQCRKLLRTLDATAHVHADTAGAAADIAQRGDPAHAAIASTLAAEIYGLTILQRDVQDADNNYTRFIVLTRAAPLPPYDEQTRFMTSLVFQVRNMPAALYKALEGFAINDINLAKLESYQDENFRAARFFGEVEGHPDSPAMKKALALLRERTAMLRVLGAYPAHPFRQQAHDAPEQEKP